MNWVQFGRLIHSIYRRGGQLPDLDWIQSLGLLAVKLGQVHALRIDFLDREKCEHLAKLYRRNAALPPEDFLALLRSSAVAGFLERFAEIEQTALASASVGQVHRARLKTGESVVIKAIKRNVRSQFSADVASLKRLFRLATFAYPKLRQVGDPVGILGDIEEYTLSELDLRHEVAGQRALRAVYDQHRDTFDLSRLAFARVHEPLCNENVMVSEFIPGRSFDELLEAGAMLSEFTEQGQSVIRAELRRRGFEDPVEQAGFTTADPAVQVGQREADGAAPSPSCLRCETELRFLGTRKFHEGTRWGAIGEIGLDYHYDFSPRPVQQDLFRRQTALARELQLPVVIHTREATPDTFEILRNEGSGVRGVFHCFTGDAAMARQALDIGFYVSFSGIITFPRSAEIREAARIVPADRLLAETDSPYLAPVPHRGKRNEPAHVVRVVEALAEVRGEARSAVEAAAQDCLGPPRGRCGAREHAGVDVEGGRTALRGRTGRSHPSAGAARAKPWQLPWRARWHGCMTAWHGTHGVQRIATGFHADVDHRACCVAQARVIGCALDFKLLYEILWRRERAIPFVHIGTTVERDFGGLVARAVNHHSG